MRFFSLYRVELRRLLLTKFIWLISALCLCSPILGYTVYKPVTAEAMSGLYIGNPVLAGTAAGAVLWAVIAVFEADRQRRSGTDILADSAAPPTAHSAAKTAALMTISAAVTLLCALLYIPFTAAKLEYLFDASFYFMNFCVFMLPTWWISILFADGLYRISRRVELSAVMYAALAYMSYSRFAERNWFMQWLNPTIGTYSDGFPDIWFLRLGAYTRLVWLCIAAGAWAFSLICTRKYQKGLGGSFVRGLKKAYLPVSAAAFVAAGTVLWNVQPFVGHGGEEYDLENEYEYMDYQRRYAMPVTTADISLKFNTVWGTLSGRAEYQLTETAKGENVLRLNAGYKIKKMTYGGEPVQFRTVKKDINGQYETYFELPDKYGEKLIIEYGGFPTIAQCRMLMISESIGSNYIRLKDSDFSPRLGNYIANSANLEVTLPDDLTPFIHMEHEQLTNFTDNGDGTRTYRTTFVGNLIYDFIAGSYVTDKFSSDDYDFNLIYGDIYRSVVEEYDVRQAICDVFDYCTKHYGKPIYIDSGSFTLFQMSAITGGGYAGAGMSTWLEDVISPSTLSDRYKGTNATEIFLHEMIHQWWGGVGMWCDDSDGVWSAEGLTVYSTYRLVKEKYGEMYAKQYYVDVWTREVEEQNRNFYNRHPEYLEKLPERYREHLRATNKTVNQYRRMPLMILKAEELVGGEEKMDEILRNMLTDSNKKGEQYAVTYKEFLDYCGLTEEDLRLD